MTKSSRTTEGRERGFTLIELMVVIVILGLLLGVVVPNVFSSLKSATRDTALNQMASFKGAIDLYMIENKSLPKSLDELTQPSPKSGEPYITKIPNDPWNEAYDYKVINASKREYEILSAGEDKQFGTADDVRYPERDEK